MMFTILYFHFTYSKLKNGLQKAGEGYRSLFAVDDNYRKVSTSWVSFLNRTFREYMSENQQLHQLFIQFINYVW
jgi:hypothetical protein